MGSISIYVMFYFQDKQKGSFGSTNDTDLDERERQGPLVRIVERPDERNPTNITNNNLESNGLDLAPQGLVNSTNITDQGQINPPGARRQSKVHFTIDNNFFKNVAENKDIAKLVSQLATCINTTKTV